MIGLKAEMPSYGELAPALLELFHLEAQLTCREATEHIAHQVAT